MPSSYCSIDETALPTRAGVLRVTGAEPDEPLRPLRFRTLPAVRDPLHDGVEQRLRAMPSPSADRIRTAASIRSTFLRGQE